MWNQSPSSKVSLTSNGAPNGGRGSDSSQLSRYSTSLVPRDLVTRGDAKPLSFLLEERLVDMPWPSHMPQIVRGSNSTGSKIANTKHTTDFYSKTSFRNQKGRRLVVDPQQNIQDWKQSEDSMDQRSSPDSLTEQAAAKHGSGDTLSGTSQINQDRFRKRSRCLVVLDPGEIETEDFSLVWKRSPSSSSSRNGNPEVVTNHQRWIFGTPHSGLPGRCSDECLIPRVNNLGSIVTHNPIALCRGGPNTMDTTLDNLQRYAGASVAANSFERPDDVVRLCTQPTNTVDCNLCDSHKNQLTSAPTTKQAMSSSPCLELGCSKSASHVDDNVMVISSADNRQSLAESMADFIHPVNDALDHARQTIPLRSSDNRTNSCCEPRTDLTLHVELTHSSDSPCKDEDNSEFEALVGPSVNMSSTNEELVLKSPSLQPGSIAMVVGGILNGVCGTVTEVRGDQCLLRTLIDDNQVDWWLKSSDVLSMDHAEELCQQSVDIQESHNDPLPFECVPKKTIPLSTYNALDDEPLPLAHASSMEGDEFETFCQDFVPQHHDAPDTEIDSLPDTDNIDTSSACTIDILDSYDFLDGIDLLGGVSISSPDSFEHLNVALCSLAELGSPSNTRNTVKAVVANANDRTPPLNHQFSVSSIRTSESPPSPGMIPDQTGVGVGRKKTEYCKYSVSWDGTLSLEEVKRELRALGAPTTGNKLKLVHRLRALRGE